MRFSTVIVGFFLVFSLCEAAVVQKRTYRNTEEILVPVTIIKDGEEIRNSADLKENETVPQIENLAAEAIAEDIATAVVEEQKLETVVEAQRRLDEAIIEEEIKEAVQEEQDKEIIKVIEEENKLIATIPEVPEIVAVLQPQENSEAIEEPAKQLAEKEIIKSLDLKTIAVEKETPNRVVVIVENTNDETEQEPAGILRQATQATPTQSTTPQNFVQQLLQNSPLGQFFNQITGQTTQGASDEAAPAVPGLFNPVAAVQSAAQSVVNSTTQAFQGLQQFASNLGNQFQNTLSGLGGQQQGQSATDATTARPAGPIQQLVNSFMGNNGQQAQLTPTPQRPLQGLLNIFQGTNRPPVPTVVANVQLVPAIDPRPENSEPAPAAENDDISFTTYQSNNDIRDSVIANDSLEDSVNPEELIVVNDETLNETNQEEKNEENQDEKQEVQKYSK